jgi:RNA-directed DNA polymerase
VASPLLANVYLHYVLDQWARHWRSRHARGDMVIVRFADDAVIGFQHQGDAKQFLHDLRERFAKVQRVVGTSGSDHAGLITDLTY